MGGRGNGDRDMDVGVGNEGPGTDSAGSRWGGDGSERVGWGESREGGEVEDDGAVVLAGLDWTGVDPEDLVVGCGR